MYSSYLVVVFGVFFLKIELIWCGISPSYDVKQFKQDWCRQKKAALDWKAILEPCKHDMEYKNVPRSRVLEERTSSDKSVITNILIGPTGQFSHIWIESRDALGKTKQYGGDSWRVMVRGNQATVAADVFDLNNGTYEALFLLMEPGVYSLDIKLDYTLCDGLRNPPMEWFHKVHCSGVLPNKTDIGTELFADMKDYLDQPLRNGQPIKITVPSSSIDIYSFKQLIAQADNDCDLSCRKLWDGYGRWHDTNNWRPNVQEINVPPEDGLYHDDRLNEFDGRLNLDYISNHIKGRGIFWIYGDSLSFYFYESFSQRQDFCQNYFRMCNVSYNWIYPKTLYQLTETCSETKLEVPKILYYVREVTNNPGMDEQSALIFNAGAHYVKTTSFAEYQKAIKGMAKVLSGEFKGKAIWKSTAAIHDQTATIMGSFRRFTTDQRVKLFNAFSNSEMCKAGITFLDIYPISASYPTGTKDGIHYYPEVFKPVEELLVHYFNH